MARGRWRAVAATAIAVAALSVLSGCDAYMQVEVTNGCTEPIEIKDVAAPVDIAGTEVAPGATATVEGEDGPIDVAVRAPGSSADPIYIDWEDMEVRGEQAGRDVTVEGDNCPDSSA